MSKVIIMGEVGNLSGILSGCHRTLEDIWWNATASQKEMDLRVTHLALQALAQLSAAAITTGAVLLYMGSAPISMLLFGMALMEPTCRLAIDVSAYVMVRQGWLADPDGQIKRVGLRQDMVDSCQRSSALSLLNTAGMAGPNVFIHEVGHAAIGMACYRNANPTITICPFQGGVTCLQSLEELTTFGKMLGGKQAQLLLLLGGVIASTLFALAEFAVAHATESTRPRLSEMLELHGVTQLTGEFLYGAFSLLDPTGMRMGDFCRAWELAGLHPIVVLALIALIPLAQRAYLSSADRLRM